MDDPASTVARPTAAPGARDVPRGLQPMHGLTVALVVLVWAVEILFIERAVVVMIGDALLIGADGAMANFVALLSSVVALAWAGVAVAWMYRARQNAQRIEAGGMDPAWAVAAWFIPLAYLILGYFVVREIWRRTHNSVEPPWLVAGWLLWSVPLGATHIVGLGQGELLQWPGVAIAFLPPWARVVSTLLHVASAVLFTRFVLDVSRAQDAGSAPAQPRSGAARVS